MGELNPKKHLKSFLDHSNVQFTNPFLSFKQETNQEPRKQHVQNNSFHVANSFNHQRNFPKNKRENKGRSTFGFQAPNTNAISLEPIKISPPIFKPHVLLQQQRGPIFIAKNNFKRRAPGRFYPPYIPGPKPPVAVNHVNDVNDGEFSDINEINDEDFWEESKKFSDEAFKVNTFEEENNDTDYSDDFFTDPDIEDFDFSDFDEFESFENQNEKIQKIKPDRKDPTIKEKKPDFQTQNTQFKRESYANRNKNSRSKFAPKAFKEGVQKKSEKSKNVEMDFNYSTEGLEMFKKNKNRKPTYKDPYRKPDPKYSPFKKTDYDPEEEFEPLFDFGDPVSGFGSDFAGPEFDFGPNDEAAEQEKTFHHDDDDFRQDYDKTQNHDFNQAETHKENDHIMKTSGFGDDFDDDKEYLDKVFSEFKDKYKDVHRNVENRRISHKNMDDGKVSDELPKMITEPFEQTDVDSKKDRADKYDYVHEKLMTDDQWETINLIPAARESLGHSEQEVNYADFSFANKKGKEFVDDEIRVTDGGAW